MKEISIIIPYLNEPDNQVYKTVKNIYETASDSKFEIIVIDDCSKEKYIADLKSFPGVRHIRNQKRLGSGASKHLGMTLANTKFLCVLDAHMRFSRGWLDLALECVSREPETCWCTSCMQLGYGVETLERATVEYTAATILFLDQDAHHGTPCREIVEAKWSQKKLGEVEYEVPCILGANYILSKKWVDHIKGLKGLTMWGTEEPFLSLKTWMAGGKCKINRRIRIGHFFRDRAPYATNVWALVYNKMFLCKTILPEEIGNKLIGYMPKNGSFSLAMAEIEKNSKSIEEDRQYYQSIFKASIQDYCHRFNIQLP